jgi:hypothetical protein
MALLLEKGMIVVCWQSLVCLVICNILLMVNHCVYGDPAYPISVHMQCSFKGPQLTPLQKEYNAAMSRVRVSVEWVFGDIANYFAFLDFKKNLKVLSGKCTWFVHYLQMPEHAFTSQ